MDLAQAQTVSSNYWYQEQGCLAMDAGNEIDALLLHQEYSSAPTIMQRDSFTMSLIEEMRFSEVRIQAEVHQLPDHPILRGTIDLQTRPPRSGQISTSVLIIEYFILIVSYCICISLGNPGGVLESDTGEIPQPDIDYTGDICYICFDFIHHFQATVRLVCGHFFHLDCMHLHLLGDTKCPKCKRKISNRFV